MVTSPLSVWKARRVCCLLVLASLRRKQLLVCVCGRKACRVCLRAGWEAAPGWSLDNFLLWAGLLLNQPLAAGCGAQEGGQRGRRALPSCTQGLGAGAAVFEPGPRGPPSRQLPGFHSGFCSRPPGAPWRPGGELVGDAEGECFFSSGADALRALRSLWRNGRARWTSNPEVPGSSPGRDGL